MNGTSGAAKEAWAISLAFRCAEFRNMNLKADLPGRAFGRCPSPSMLARSPLFSREAF